MEGGKGKRSFTVIEIRKASQKNKSGSLKKTKGDGGYFKSSNPAGAARKAFNASCRSKSIKGQCTFVVTIQEITQGSAGKVFKYECKRIKLDTPIELLGRTIEYDTKVKSMN
jgi:hypothetical protein